jgi:transcriptional regulator with XRE-family HTH domain
MANLTPKAGRAARAILHWSVSELADEAGVAFSTVHRFEKTGVATETTKAKMISSYARKNVLRRDGACRLFDKEDRLSK